MQLLVESAGVIYDLTDSCTSLTWTDPLNDGASYLDIEYIADGLLIENGSAVRLTSTDQKTGYFFGTVFKIATSENGIVTVKAYDKLRYCKTKDTIVCDGDTLPSLVTKMCNFFAFPPGELAPVEYKVKDNVFTDKTWLDIIYTAISDTLIGTQKYYCLRDENGSICLRDMEELQLPLILGDASLVYGYSYERSIDDEFYNQVKLVSENEKTGKGDVFEVFDSESIGKYGLLQYYEKIDSNVDAAKAKDKADALLKLYNRETEKLTFSCVGDMTVRAGCSIIGIVQGIKLERRLIVSKVVHNFMPVHTMDIEVMTG